MFQIIPPHDSGIQSSIEEQLQPWEGAWDVQAALDDPRLSDPLAVMMERYYSRLAAMMLDIDVNNSTPVQFTVTAMHGVGHRYMERAFKECGFKVSNRTGHV